MMSRSQKAWALAAALALVCLLAGCGNDPLYLVAPESWTLENVALQDPYSIPRAPVPVGVDIIMDTTDSMAGFAQNPAIDGKTAFVRSMGKLLYAASSYSSDSDVRFYRSDAIVKQISPNLFSDYAAPGFYVPRKWYEARKIDTAGFDADGFYSASNIADAIKSADPGRVTVIITDLFENKNTNEQLIRQIKQKYLAAGGTAAVLALRSEFDGKVYDIFETNTEDGIYYHGVADLKKGDEPPTIADIPKWAKAVSTAGDEGPVDMEKLALKKLKDVTPAYRPFYMLFLGEEDVVQAFVKDYLDELRKMEGAPVEIGEPPLMFVKKEKPMLIATDDVGSKLAMNVEGHRPLELVYVSYDESGAEGGMGKEADLRTLPQNLWSLLCNTDNANVFEAKIPLSLIASENAGGDERLLREMYGVYELVPQVTIYEMASGDIFLEEQRKRFRALLMEPYDLNPTEQAEAFSFSGGAFIMDEANKFRANGEMSVRFDPFKLPAGLDNCRVEIGFWLRLKNTVVVESDPLEHYPWAKDWVLNVAGKTAQDWEEFPSMRKLNATINLDSFAKALIRSKEEIEEIDPNPFPAEKLINVMTFDLMLKR